MILQAQIRRALLLPSPCKLSWMQCRPTGRPAPAKLRIGPLGEKNETFKLTDALMEKQNLPGITKGLEKQSVEKEFRGCRNDNTFWLCPSLLTKANSLWHAQLTERSWQPSRRLQLARGHLPRCLLHFTRVSLGLSLPNVGMNWSLRCQKSWIYHRHDK